MIRNTLLSIALAVASTTAFAKPVTYVIDPTHTDVLFAWNHFGFSNPTAHLGEASGTIVFDAADPTASSVEVTLPLDGLSSHVAKLDEHLKAADFLDSAKYPAISFKSTKVDKGSTDKSLVVTGDLTIRDITKPVVLAVTLNGQGEHPMKKVPAIGFDATTTIQRSDFGVDKYIPAVSDELKISITTEATAAK